METFEVPEQPDRPGWQRIGQAVTGLLVFSSAAASALYMHFHGGIGLLWGVVLFMFAVAGGICAMSAFD